MPTPAKLMRLPRGLWKYAQHHTLPLCLSGIVTDHSGQTRKSVTIDQNQCSRQTGIVGHDPPE
jgi:hypothetical protein